MKFCMRSWYCTYKLCTRVGPSSPTEYIIQAYINTIQLLMFCMRSWYCTYKLCTRVGPSSPTEYIIQAYINTIQL